MAIQTFNPISVYDCTRDARQYKDDYTAISGATGMGNFNKGGIYFPDTGVTPNSSLPSAANTAGNSYNLNAMKGVHRNMETFTTITNGFANIYIGKYGYTSYGFSQGYDGATYGSLSYNPYMTTPIGTVTIVGLNYFLNNTVVNFALAKSTSWGTTDSDNNFTRIIITDPANNVVGNYARSSLSVNVLDGGFYFAPAAATWYYRSYYMSISSMQYSSYVNPFSTGFYWKVKLRYRG
jgi:hypothetical protein